jgi:hypothetical protein
MRQTIRTWFEAIESPFMEIIFEPRRGKKAALGRVLLFVLSSIYRSGLVIHRPIRRG